MDLQCFPVNFCTDFPLKVKYCDFHKIYINIFKENLNIYKNHPSVTDCRLYYVFRLTCAIDFPNLYLTYLVFHDTWSESLTTLSESQYVYQENYHSMVQCAVLNCTVKSGHGISTYLFPQIAKVKKKYGQYVWNQMDFSQVSTQNFVRDISRRISLLSIRN
jgi:hypothetical protein